MKLTEEKAIDISIELWAYLAETGRVSKGRWPGWKEYGRMYFACALCEFTVQQGYGCPSCPYYQKFGLCSDKGKPYSLWVGAIYYRPSPKKRKKYAREFLKQLYQLKEEK